MHELVEGIDFLINEDGYVVLTAKYHLERGYCCGNGCKLCPYEYNNVEEPRRSYLLSLNNPKDTTKRD